MIAHTSVNLAKMTLPPPTRCSVHLTVLDVTKWFGETSGGVRTYLMEKGAYVRRQPHLRQVLVVPGPDDELTDTEGVRTYRLRGPRIPTQQQYRFLFATRTLRRIVEHERPDVIEVGSQIFVPWIARLATRNRPTPLIGFYHGNLERSMASPVNADSRAARASLSRVVLRNYLRAVDGLFAARFAASESLARDLRDAGIRDITRVRLGVDLGTFHPSRRLRRDQTRLAHGIPLDEKAVVYCGRIAHEKDIAWLVRAWPAAQSLTRAWLVLMGEGPLKAELQTYTRARRARILWLPYESDRSRVADLLACADALVSPGPVETFGLSALEAMACGTPVLSVACGAGAELVRRSRAGTTYRIRDDEHFAAKLYAVLYGADEAQYGLRGRRHAEREHSWDHAFDELFAIYARLIGR